MCSNMDSSNMLQLEELEINTHNMKSPGHTVLALGGSIMCTYMYIYKIITDLKNLIVAELTPYQDSVTTSTQLHQHESSVGLSSTTNPKPKET